MEKQITKYGPAEFINTGDLAVDWHFPRANVHHPFGEIREATECVSIPETNSQPPASM